MNEIEEITIDTVRRNRFYKPYLLAKRKQWLDKQRKQDKREVLNVNHRIYNIQHRGEIKAYNKKYHQRPELKEKLKKYHKEYQQRPEIKKRLNEYQKEYYQRPEVKAKRKIYYDTPENKAKRAISQKKYRGRPDVKKRKAEYNKKRYERIKQDKINNNIYI